MSWRNEQKEKAEGTDEGPERNRQDELYDVRQREKNRRQKTLVGKTTGDD